MRDARWDEGDQYAGRGDQIVDPSVCDARSFWCGLGLMAWGGGKGRSRVPSTCMKLNVRA